MVLVALPDDPALSLFQIRRPPRAVHVMQRHRPRLDVGAGAHLGCRADQHRDLSVPAPGEQFLAGLVGGRVVDEGDLLGVHAPLHQLASQRVVHVPLILTRGGLITEDDLQPTGPGRSRTGLVQIHPVTGALLNIHDLLGHRGRPASVRIGIQAHQAPVQGQFPTIAHDLEHVVRALLRSA